MIEKLEHNEAIPVKVQYAFIDDFITIKKLNNKLFLDFKTGEDWKDFASVLFSIKIKEECKNTIYGIECNTKIDFAFAGDDINTSLNIIELTNRKLLLLISYNDGQQKILGFKETPVFLQYNLNTDILPEYQFSIKHNNRLLFAKQAEEYMLLINDQHSLLVDNYNSLIV